MTAGDRFSITIDVNSAASPDAKPLSEVRAPILGVWRGSAVVGLWTINEELVFQSNGSFNQLTAYSSGGMIQRNGTYSVAGPGPQSGAGMISLHTLWQSQGILQDDGIPFYLSGPDTMMMRPNALANWIPYQRVG